MCQLNVFSHQKLNFQLVLVLHGQIPRRTLNSTNHNNTVKFNNTDLDCNTGYLPKVIATLKDNINIQPFTKYGSNIYYLEVIIIQMPVAALHSTNDIDA